MVFSLLAKSAWVYAGTAQRRVGTVPYSPSVRLWLLESRPKGAPSHMHLRAPLALPVAIHATEECGNERNLLERKKARLLEVCKQGALGLAESTFLLAAENGNLHYDFQMVN